MSALSFRIVAHPDFKTVMPGAIVSYQAHLDAADSDANIEGYKFKWSCINDPLAAEELGEQSIYLGPSTRNWNNAVWSFRGRHKIILEVTSPDGQVAYCSHTQWVDSAHNILGREFDPKANDQNPGPFQTLAQNEVYLQTLLDIAKVKPPPPDKREDHEQKIDQLKQYIEHLKFLLEGFEGKEAYAVDAVHIDKERSTRTSLLLWLINTGMNAGNPKWALVDWTNPSYQHTSGVYADSGVTHQDAIEKIVEKWDCDNQYPEGLIKYEFSVPSYKVNVPGEFETDGASFFDSASGWLEYVALGGAIVAGVVTLVAPVPGSRVLSAAIWTSIFTSTAAATINIAQRHAAGHGNWKDDAFDGLSIVGNLFAGAGMAWRIGAQLTSATRFGGSMSKAVLIGQISTDGLQGVMLGYEHVGEYQSIMDDPRLSPDERLEKLVALFGSAALSGTMIYVSVKGARNDLDNLNGGRTLFTKGDIENASTVIDLDNPVSSVPIKGHDKTVKTNVETEGGSKELGTQSKRDLRGKDIAAKEGGKLPPELGKKISQKQLRHIKGRPEWTTRGEGSYVKSVDDAQAVLDAAHSGNARVLGTTKQGHVVVEFKGVTGYNNNPGAGFVDQPTNVFMIKGTKSPSVVPTSPTWKPPTSP